MTTKGDEVVFPAGDEIDGFWNLDKMHAPRPVSPLSFDLIVRTLAEGFTKAHEDYDCPIMVSTKEINHYLYFAFHPLPDEAEVARRMVHYHEKLAEKVPTVGRTWEEVWKPAVIARNVALKTAPLVGPHRRGGAGQAGRVDRLHALPVVDPRARQLRAVVEQCVL